MEWTDISITVAKRDADTAEAIATGISGGTFLRGVQFSGQGAVTHSMIIRSKTGTMRYIESHHNWNKLMQISSIKYD